MEKDSGDGIWFFKGAGPCRRPGLAVLVSSAVPGGIWACCQAAPLFPSLQAGGQPTLHGKILGAVHLTRFWGIRDPGRRAPKDPKGKR